MSTEPTDLDHFEEILQHLQQTRGFDFTAYKRTSLIRRMSKRMQTVNVSSFEEYFDYLQVHQEEFAALFNTILINVTSFFRDTDVWDYLERSALPQILSARGKDDAFRVWTAGCASGQEAYSVMMVLGELMGVEAVRDRVKVYATDADEEALAEARAAAYTAKQVESIAPERLEKYFDRAGTSYVFKRELRRSVIFGRHDLVQDAPISRVDFLLCRNTLMYFNADAQSRILARFFFSLNPGAHILLGRAEMLFSHANMFTPVDLKRRLFKAVPRPSHRDRPTELRGAIDKAVETGTEVTISDVQSGQAGEVRIFDVAISPLSDDDGVVIGTRIVYEDVTELRTLQVQLQHSKQELETAYEELQSTNEELETTNEELQSTVEELETTNEELQSTNEELETMNEELQSTNEELQTMNDELRNRSTDLNAVNSFLESVFASLRSAVVVIDKDFRVLVWNDRSVDLWGLRSEEAQGGHFLSLDIGLPVGELRQPVREVLSGSRDFSETVLAATNRKGKPVQIRVSVAPLRQLDSSASGAILLMEEATVAQIG